jgi:predicted acylesterase/phospholipase RssA
VEWEIALRNHKKEPATILVRGFRSFLYSAISNSPLRRALNTVRSVKPIASRAHAAAPPRGLAAAKATVQRRSIATKLFGLGSGYIEALPNGTRRLLPGHTFALVQLGLTLVFYVVLVFGKSLSGASIEEKLWVPTAGAVVLLLLLNSWMLAAVTFFFDRYRIPLFTVVVSVTLITGSRACTDYEVATKSPTEAYQLATPGEVLAAYPRPLVLAVGGGGIQAGAWGARVLQGIDERLRKDGGLGLRERAALVSGVSGGSMGALYYGAYEDTNVSEATTRSLQPSLDEIASALIGVERLRHVLAWRVGVDRGAALERSWATRLPLSGQFTLRAWSDKVREFARHERGTNRPFPAFLFNTTIVETGQPMGFITTQFPTPKYRKSFLQSAKEYPIAESANHVFKLSADGQSAQDVGLEMVTAARLSSAFPYVSPAATLKIEGSERFHIVDGGYYDNYGFSARLAYTFRSHFFVGLDRSTPQYQDDTDNLAASLRYRINNNFTLTFDALNLNNPTLKYYGANTDQPRAFYKNGRQYYAGVQISF